MDQNKGQQNLPVRVLAALTEAKDDDDDANNNVCRGSGACVGGDRKIRVKSMKMR